ncbi:hypothetical protein H4R20_000243 [Coemansia guatemalensis]|uniref:Cyclin N-terminal domain-containing protein n=1 Tax=Coemansia guatemalensis TaxID=2761395 RepID=A0A9W8LVL7_9FUNG|nr:hypothetical protein H4R20_000243 [Coemansia guatemalensis]
MISSTTVHALAERKTKNLLSMRPAWMKKEATAAAAASSEAGQQSPVSSKIRELTTSGRSKPKALSRSRIRELLTLAVIRLMERMIAELFPCANDGEPGGGLSGSSDAGANGPLPSFEEFLKHICRRTRTPLTCMCLALLYLTRLRANHPRSRGSPGSSYRLALSSLCVATKYLYDDAYHTCSWVQVSMGLFNQREVNQMEMEFMYFLHYQLGVTPTEWNQWVATLEAKLVSRWQENGKADVIYSFGLFLSYECCESSAQEAVRDVAWGEGGKSLLALLDNAIHSSRDVDPAKCSPSADSAVSDATCMPTPDPSTWFRIRSPALSNTPYTGADTAAATAIAGSSASITPNTAQFTDIAVLGDDFVASNSKQQQQPSCVRHSYVDNRGLSPSLQKYATVAASASAFALRPSSSCSVPGTYATPGLTNNTGNRGKYLSAANMARPGNRHVSESGSHSWMPHVSSQLVLQDGSDSAMAGYPQASQHMKTATTSPFEALSGNIASTSRSYSGESRDSAGSRIPSGRTYKGPVNGVTHTSRQYPHYGADHRLSAIARGALSNSGYSDMSFDVTDGQALAGHAKVASMCGQIQGTTSMTGSGIGSNGATISCSGYASNACSETEIGQMDSYSSDDTSRLVPQHDPGMTLMTASRLTSPADALQSQHQYNRNKYLGGGIAGPNSRSAMSPKSSTSSLRGNGRRHSWRYSGRHSAAHFAQKLRSLAAFSWASGGAGAKNLDGSMSTSSSYASSQQDRNNYHGYHTMHSGASRRSSNTQAPHAILANMHKGAEDVKPSHNLELDLPKYMSMRS